MKHALPILLMVFCVWFSYSQRDFTPPGPTPDPVDYKPLIGDGGLNVLVVEETDSAASVAVVVNAEDWQVYVESKGGDIRIFDQHQVVADQKWKAALLRPRTALPWVIVSGPKSGFEGPLPTTAEAMLALVKEHGG